MEEFEKQWKCGMLSGSPETFSGASTKESARFNWRAALGWLETVATAIEVDEDGDGFDIVDLHRIIKEECEQNEKKGTKND